MLWAQIVLLIVQTTGLIIAISEQTKKGRVGHLWTRVAFILAYATVLYLAGSFSRIIP